MSAYELATVKLGKLKPDTKNARKHSDRNIGEIMKSLEQFGQHRPFVVQRCTNKILVGNGMYEAMKKLGWTEGQALYVDDDDETAVKRALADNRTAELAEWDDEILAALVKGLGEDIELPGWSDEELKLLLNDFGTDNSGEALEEESRLTLAERFGVAPFSVLNAREGNWQERKKAWLRLGIQSEVGRGSGERDSRHTGGLLFRSTSAAPDSMKKRRRSKRNSGEN